VEGQGNFQIVLGRIAYFLIIMALILVVILVVIQIVRDGKGAAEVVTAGEYLVLFYAQ